VRAHAQTYTNIQEVPLGASIFCKVLFSYLGAGKRGTFFKEASKTGTSLPDGPSPWSILGCSDIHMNMYAYMRVRIYMYISVYVCAYVCIYVALSCPAPCPWSILGCSDIHMYMHACIYTCTDIYVRFCVCKCMHMYIYSVPRRLAPETYKRDLYQ